MKMDLINPKGEHYNLRWNNYSNNLIQVFSENQQQETLVDITLICEGHYVKAHKLILSACSGFFQELFRDYGHISNPFIVLSGIKLSHLKHIVDFIYKGEIKVLDSDLEGVLALGEHFQVKGLCSVKVKQSSCLSDSNGALRSTDVQNNAKSQISDRDEKTDQHVNEPKEISRKEDKPLVKSLSKVKSPSIKQSPQKENNLKTRVTQQIDSEQPFRKKMKTQVINKETPSNENTILSEHEVVDKKDEVAKRTKPEGKIDGNSKNSQVSLQTSTTTVNVDKIPRPANAFMIFANEWRNKLTVEHPEEDSKSISVRLGNMWKSLSAEIREKYYSAARQGQLEHQIKYPGYYVHVPSSKIATRRQTVESMDFSNSEESKGSEDDLQIVENQAEEAADVANLPNSCSENI